MDLRVARVGEVGALAVRSPDRAGVARHGVGREEERIAVATGREHHSVPRVRHDLTRQEVAGDDARAATVDHDDVEHLDAVPEVDVAEADLARQLLVGPEQQLLPRLTAGIERAADLGTTEAAIVEQAAVLTRRTAHPGRPSGR